MSNFITCRIQKPTTDYERRSIYGFLSMTSLQRLDFIIQFKSLLKFFEQLKKNNAISGELRPIAVSLFLLKLVDDDIEIDCSDISLSGIASLVEEASVLLARYAKTLSNIKN